MRDLLRKVSPDLDDALQRLVRSAVANEEDLVHISLLCASTRHLMKFPIYEKNCSHVEVTPRQLQLISKCIELSHFVKWVSVGLQFNWACPICRSHCNDELLLVMDKWVIGVLESHQTTSKKKFFKIKRDGGEIIGDSASESDSESEETGDEENC